MKSMPSVWMKAGMRRRTTTRPLTRPTQGAGQQAAEERHAAPAAPAAVISLAATTAESPATEPTERSNSPVISSIVWPMAMMPTKETTRRMARTLRSETKAGSSAVKKSDQQDQRRDHADLADGDEARAGGRGGDAAVVVVAALRCHLLPFRGRCERGLRSRPCGRAPPIRPTLTIATLPEPSVASDDTGHRRQGGGGRFRRTHGAVRTRAGGAKPIGRLGVRDIARQVGLAPMTVSRVLSNPELVAPATRAKVLEAIEQRRLRAEPARLLACAAPGGCSAPWCRR